MGGGSSVQIPMHLDIETFRNITGGPFNDPIFQEFSVDGVMSREKLLELAQTTDCFLSFDRNSPDAHGRDNTARVMAVYKELRQRGLVCWLLEEQVANIVANSQIFNANQNNNKEICDAIDKTRSILCFMSTNYVDRIGNPNTVVDQCQIEFTYGVRQKFPEKMISVVMEEGLLFEPSQWRGNVGQFLLNANAVEGAPKQGPIPSWNENVIDMVADPPTVQGNPEDHSGGKWEQQMDMLFSRIMAITRHTMVTSKLGVTSFVPGGSGRATKGIDKSMLVGASSDAHGIKHVAPLPQVKGLPPHATREDAQFFQWMARTCTSIPAQRRAVYCGSLEHLGVKRVQDLAVRMQQEPNFLMTCGVSERDADEIALQVSDLGLGYHPVTDFSNAETIESAVYAIKKSCDSAADANLGANALACVARIANSDPCMPESLMHAGVCEPIVKILQRNLSDTNCVVWAYRALQGLAVSDEICSHLTQSCEVVPRALLSHLNDETVVFEGCKLVSQLARLPANSNKLGTAGACDVVMKGLLKHINSVQVAHQGCAAANRLAYGNFENVGKLGYHNACIGLSSSIKLHYSDENVAEEALVAINILAVEPENRSKIGALGGCEGVVNAANFHMNKPVIVDYSMRVITQMIVGNANNRSRFGQLGATDTVAAVLQQYTALRDQDDASMFAYPEIVQFACTSTYSLAAGSPEIQQKLKGLIPLFQALVQATIVRPSVTGPPGFPQAHAHTHGHGPGTDTSRSNNTTNSVHEKNEVLRRINKEATEALQRITKV